MVKDYVKAKSRTEKSTIITALVDHVHRISPLGGFVRANPATGNFYEVGDLIARETTSQIFRDALHEKYASSKKSRRTRKQLKLSKLTAAKNNKNKIVTIPTITCFGYQPQSYANISLSTMKLKSAQGEESILFDALLSKLPENFADFGNPFEPIPIQETFFQPSTTNGCYSNEVGNYFEVLISPRA